MSLALLALLALLAARPRYSYELRGGRGSDREHLAAECRAGLHDAQPAQPAQSAQSARLARLAQLVQPLRLRDGRRRYDNEYWHFELLAAAKGSHCPAREPHA